MKLLEDELRDEARTQQNRQYISGLLIAAAVEIERLRSELAKALCTGGNK